MTELEKRLEKRLRQWRRLAETYRDAQHEREPSEEEWELNRAWADAFERCASELGTDLSAAKAIKRSQYEPRFSE
jgi:hypothetical protein